jgi:biopolymer transport protein ExbB/TolQ
MTEPYHPPQASLISSATDEPLRRRRKFWLRAIWISIAGVIIPPIFGLIGTVVGMVGAFGELSKTGEADPNALAAGISVSLLTTAWGLIVSAIAFLVLIGVLIRFFTLPKVAGTPTQNPQGQQDAP